MVHWYPRVTKEVKAWPSLLGAFLCDLGCVFLKYLDWRGLKLEFPSLPAGLSESNNHSSGPAPGTGLVMSALWARSSSGGMSKSSHHTSARMSAKIFVGLGPSIESGRSIILMFFSPTATFHINRFSCQFSITSS